MGSQQQVGKPEALDPRVLPLLPQPDAPAPQTRPGAEVRAGIMDIILAAAGAASRARRA